MSKEPENEWLEAIQAAAPIANALCKFIPLAKWVVVGIVAGAVWSTTLTLRISNVEARQEKLETRFDQHIQKVENLDQSVRTLNTLLGNKQPEEDLFPNGTKYARSYPRTATSLVLKGKVN